MRKSMQIFAGSTVILAVVFAIVSLTAQEHPQEHPEEEGQEHPEHEEKEGDALKKEFLEELESYLEFKLGDTDTVPVAGILPVQTLEGKPVEFEGDLSLEKLHRDKVIQYGENTYFVCADFKESSEEGTTMYDFDFFMVKKGDNWRMGCILLHKVNGEKKITYHNNKPVPAGEKKEDEHPDSEHPDSEHPK